MTTLRDAAQQALEALQELNGWQSLAPIAASKAAVQAEINLSAALEEPEGGGNLPPPFPVKFDHAIGADRFKVVRGAFWWHVLIGDSPTEHGKFRSRAGAEKMAADLLREFRNGAFVQHDAALAEPVQEPVASVTECEACFTPDVCQLRGTCDHYAAERLRVAAPPQREPVHQWRKQMCADWYDGHPDHSDGGGPYETRVLYSAPPQRKPLTDEEIQKLLIESAGMTVQFSDVDLRLARAIETAHGIKDA